MSVIFQTLKKFQSQSAESSGAGRGAVSPERRKTIREILVSPFFVSIFAVTMVLSGALAVFGAKQLSHKIEAVKAPSASAFTIKGGDEIQSEPEPVILIEGPPEKTSYPPAYQSVGNSPAKPEKSTETNPSYPLYSENSNSSVYMAASQPTFVPDLIPEQSKKETGAVENPLSNVINTQMEALKAASQGDGGSTVSLPAAGPAEGSYPDKKETKINPYDDVANSPTGPLLIASTASPSATSPADLKADNALPAQLTERRKINRQAIRKTTDILSLIADARKAINEGDAEKAEFYLDELAAVKGADSIYVTNLKAFWLIKQGKFSSAELALSSILNQQPDHPDAGLNMAVVEVKTNRIHDAAKRLEILKELYPDDVRISEMLSRIR